MSINTRQDSIDSIHFGSISGQNEEKPAINGRNSPAQTVLMMHLSGYSRLSERFGFLRTPERRLPAFYDVLAIGLQHNYHSYFRPVLTEELKAALLLL